MGPARPSEMSCEASPPAGAEVILGALPTNGLKMVVTNLNGLKAHLATQDQPDAGNLGVTITTIWVSLPTKDVEISVSVGDVSVVPGGAPERGADRPDNTPSHRGFPTLLSPGVRVRPPRRRGRHLLRAALRRERQRHDDGPLRSTRRTGEEEGR